MRNLRPARRWRAALVAATTALSVLAATPAQAVTSTPDRLAGDWLVGQLTSGLVHNDQYDFDDIGLTLDVAFALDQVGGYDATLDEIEAAVAPGVPGYTTGVDWGSDDVYAGPTAKAVVFARLVGADPTTYGGVDLLAQLRARIATTKPIKGRLQDRSATDYANVIGQAYAVRALTAAGERRARSATKFLLKQQCDAGYFRLGFTKRRKLADQTCDGGNPRRVSAPDTDATALALATLVALDSDRPRVGRAIRDAARWLRHEQGRRGGFGGGTSTEKANANSTGLAGWALAAAGSCKKASAAAQWVLRRQVPDTTSGGPLATEIGAVAYDQAAYRAAKTAGITVETQDQWRRASAQAAPALVFLDVAACRAAR